MCNDQKNNNSSLFIMGLILGAIIAGVIILTSADDKAKIIKKIKGKFKDLFDDKVEPFIKKEGKIVKAEIKKDIKKINKIGRDARSRVSTVISEVPKKISVTLPSDIETLNLIPVKMVKSKKVFKKSKI